MDQTVVSASIPLFATFVVLAVGVLSLFAILEIFAIASRLKKILDQTQKILAAIKTADTNRRDEFEALAQSEG